MVQLVIKFFHPPPVSGEVGVAPEEMLIPISVLRITKPGDSVPEMVIVELQGDLETKSQSASLNGKFIGDLHFTKSDQPVLIVGHHILFGKVAKLDKPMVVVVRHAPKSETDESSAGHDCLMETSNTDSNGDVTTDTETVIPQYLVTAVVRNKIVFKTRPRPIIANVAKKI